MREIGTKKFIAYKKIKDAYKLRERCFKKGLFSNAHTQAKSQRKRQVNLYFVY
jgi:hypothetical protein